MNRRLIIFLFLTIAFFVLRFAVAQTPSSNQNDNSQVIIQQPTLHQWGAVTLFHGLPSDRVRAIAQTDDGVMWFGTDAGLARYDGRRTQTMTANELQQGKVNALSVDENKTLWIGTDNGIVLYTINGFKLIKETEGRIITAFLHVDKSRTLATSEDGFVFDIQSEMVKTIPQNHLQSPDEENPGALEITSIAKAKERIFIGSRGYGAMTLEGEDVKEVRSEPRAYFVEALETDSKGRLWFGAKSNAKSSGLYESSNPQRPRKIGSGVGTVLSLRADKQNNLWVGTDGQGVFQFRDDIQVNQFTFDGTAGGLRSNRVYEIFVDREDVVWFGTDRGVSRYDPRALRLERLSENAESNFIRVIYRTKDGKLYCGTNRGLFVQTGDVWQSVSDLQQKTIYALQEDEKGQLLVGTASGFFSLSGQASGLSSKTNEKNNEKNTGKLNESSLASGTLALPVNDSVRAIVQMGNKTYIATFGRGVESLEGENRKLIFPKNDDSKLKEINALFADANGHLWIGTIERGVFVFDGQNTNSNPIFSTLQNASINSIDGTKNGFMWFATTKGLYIFDKEKLTLILPNHDVRSVKVVQSETKKSKIENQAWCATSDGGVFKIVYDENVGVIVSVLDAEQGLPSQKTFALRQEGNVWLIGTNRGIARYETNLHAPILRASRAIGRREYSAEELKNNLLLEYPQNSFVLEVASVSSRTFPEQFQYAFTLTDSKNQIVQRKLTRETQISMQGLSAGKYKVSVIAYNSDLISSEPLTVEFTVSNAPFPWFTLLLTLLLLLAVAALVWAIFEHRRITNTSAALANANLELADARLQLANEAESERKRIARDLHDQTLADLRRLMLMSDQLNENGKKANINPSVFRSEIENISNEIRRICEDLSPSVLENVGFTAALEFALNDAVAHLPEEKRFEYEFVCDDDLEDRLNFSQSVTMQLYRVAQEAISNVCRHANAQKVRLEVLLNDDEFVMKLEDDGQGFDLESQSSGRGLANITARASLIEAEVEWLRRAEKGVVFILRKRKSFEYRL